VKTTLISELFQMIHKAPETPLESTMIASLVLHTLFTILVFIGTQFGLMDQSRELGAFLI